MLMNIRNLQIMVIRTGHGNVCILHIRVSHVRRVQRFDRHRTLQFRKRRRADSYNIWFQLICFLQLLLHRKALVATCAIAIVLISCIVYRSAFGRHHQPFHELAPPHCLANVYSVIICSSKLLLDIFSHVSHSKQNHRLEKSCRILFTFQHIPYGFV